MKSSILRPSFALFRQRCDAQLVQQLRRQVPFSRHSAAADRQAGAQHIGQHLESVSRGEIVKAICRPSGSYYVIHIWHIQYVGVCMILSNVRGGMVRYLLHHVTLPYVYVYSMYTLIFMCCVCPFACLSLCVNLSVGQLCTQ